MKHFSKSRWADPEFSKGYRDNADIFIVERKRMFEVMKSYYRHFLRDKKNFILDLGCGDGILTYNLLETDNSISATLIDPSADMLEKARERLKGFSNVNYTQASFQDLFKGNIICHKFNFIVSSMAIHHLASEEKNKLFGFVHSCLNPGGYFMNIDVVISSSDCLETWYMQLWKEWMDEKKSASGMDPGLFRDIPARYKENEDNNPDTLDEQLYSLRESGFKEVDCFYKYGIFTVYGGKKAQDFR
jgi:tRNA (cmo5U34)-methyltransferase